MEGLPQLNEEQQLAIYEAVKAKKAAEEKKKEEDKKAYKELVCTTVETCFVVLQGASEALLEAKAHVIDSFKEAMEMKVELYGQEVKDQCSNTFSNADNSIEIEIGYRTLDEWDDTVTTGMQMVEDCLDAIAVNPEIKDLIEIIKTYVHKNNKGVLDPRKLFRLEELAKNKNYPKLKEGVDIIRAAYKPKKSNVYVRAAKKNKEGIKIDLPLSMGGKKIKKGEVEVN
jgi:vacuolar-type H+-ATPase subunit E/Vma4